MCIRDSSFTSPRPRAGRYARSQASRRTSRDLPRDSDPSSNIVGSIRCSARRCAAASVHGACQKDGSGPPVAVCFL
eukprot:6032425-Alexandrium_andersonii.AAC.1